jgi:Flp pilus assembly protein TadD
MGRARTADIEATRMFSRHRPSIGRTHTVTLGILTAALLSTSVPAADTPDPFVLVAYSNRAGGSPLADGDFSAATRALTRVAVRNPLDPVAVATNRCVAYAMTRQLSAARLACDAAVEDAARADAGSVVSQRDPRASNATAALAYSNRAVLDWLSARPDAAQQDLARARALAPQADFVRHNLAAMQGHKDVPSPAALAEASAKE